MNLLENVQVAVGVPPINLASGAHEGAWVDLSRYRRCVVVFVKGAGAEEEDPTLTLEEATDLAGGGARALAGVRRVHRKEGETVAAVGGFTVTDQTPAAAFTVADVAENEALWCFEVRADQLDVDAGYRCLRVNVSDVGAGAQLGCLLYLLVEPRVAEDVLASAVG